MPSVTCRAGTLALSIEMCHALPSPAQTRGSCQGSRRAKFWQLFERVWTRTQVPQHVRSGEARRDGCTDSWWRAHIGHEDGGPACAASGGGLCRDHTMLSAGLRDFQRDWQRTGRGFCRVAARHCRCQLSNDEHASDCVQCAQHGGYAGRSGVETPCVVDARKSACVLACCR